MERSVKDRPYIAIGIYELLAEAHHDIHRDRRSSTRYPFFRQVLLDLPQPCECVAFTREVSAGGVGLLHNVQITPGEVVELSIPSISGYAIYVRARIVWCRSCGKSWFVSGGQFVGDATVALA